MTSRITPLAFVALAAALAACSTMDGGGGSIAAADSPSRESGPANASATTMAYVAAAGASDMFEIQSSQIALEKSQNAEVRRAAQMLIDHHTQTTQTLMAAAQAAGMSPPPPQMNPEQLRMIEALRAANGTAFDAEYVNGQVPAHEQALRTHQTYAANGDVPQLRSAAQSAVPIVQSHLTEFQRMQGAMPR